MATAGTALAVAVPKAGTAAEEELVMAVAAEMVPAVLSCGAFVFERRAVHVEDLADGSLVRATAVM